MTEDRRRTGRGRRAAPPACAAAGRARPQPYAANDGRGFHDVLAPGTDGVATLTADRGLPGARASAPRTTPTSSRCTATCSIRVPGLSAADAAQLLQGRDVRRARPATSRAPTAPARTSRSCATRASACRTSTAPTRDGAMFGLGLRRRRGPPVLHRRAAPRRPRAADVVRRRRRGQPRVRARAVARSPPTPRPTCSARSTSSPPRTAPRAGGSKRDLDNYVAGINQYIAEAKARPHQACPASTWRSASRWARTRGRRPTRRDRVARRRHLRQGRGRRARAGPAPAGLPQALRRPSRAAPVARLPRAGRPRGPDDGAAARAFPYEAPPGRGHPPAASRCPTAARSNRSRSSSRARTAAPHGARRAACCRAPRCPGRAVQRAASSPADKSRSGHPLAVFGPQVGYFSPQILMEQDVHAPDLDARGAAFPGVNLYVQLGRGRDYAWSATSAGQDIIDTYAVAAVRARRRQGDDGVDRLPLPRQVPADRGPAQANAWTPNAGRPARRAGSETLVAQRTKLRPGHRARDDRRQARRLHVAALDLPPRGRLGPAASPTSTTPSKIRGARDFQRAAAKIGYTFNWFYADTRDIAYFNSGNNPVRPSGARPDCCPSRPPRLRVEGLEPGRQHGGPTRRLEQHPQVVNQDYLTSWNNKQAPGLPRRRRPGFTPLYRSQLLDDGIKAQASAGTARSACAGWSTRWRTRRPGPARRARCCRGR